MSRSEGGAVRVRPMIPDDRDALVELLSTSDPWVRLGYTRDGWQRLFSALPEGREAYVAEVDGAAVGIALVRPSYMLGDYLNILAVAAGQRGRGVGRLLIEHVERVVFARAKNFFVCVSDFNTEARRFYARMGYQEVGALADLLVAGSSEILLRKTTGPLA